MPNRTHGLHSQPVILILASVKPARRQHKDKVVTLLYDGIQLLIEFAGPKRFNVKENPISAVSQLLRYQTRSIERAVSSIADEN